MTEGYSPVVDAAMRTARSTYVTEDYAVQRLRDWLQLIAAGQDAYAASCARHALAGEPAPRTPPNQGSGANLRDRTEGSWR